MTAQRFLEGLSYMFFRISFKKKLAWSFTAILIFGLCITGLMSLSSYYGHKATADIIARRIHHLPTRFIVQEQNNKNDFLNPNSLLSGPDAIFCITLSDIYSLKMYMNRGDTVATTHLFDRGDCIIDKPYLHIEIVEEKGDIVRVRREGMTQTLWTFRGACEISLSSQLVE